jgi:prolycopene isomerase
MAIGPTFKKWPKGFKNNYNNEEYQKEKEIETERVLNILEKRFPGFKENLCHVELSTPTTLNRYALKEGGSAAGPKQKLGQHMLKRLKAKSDIDRLFNCGESTVMGTGTPAVTVSGISAANLILRELKIEEYEYRHGMKNYVNRVNIPYKVEDIKISNNEKEDYLAKLALKCQFCENPVCEKACKNNMPIRDINRRVAVGNFYGGKKLLNLHKENPCKSCESKNCEKACIRKSFDKEVCIKEINSNL